MAAEGLLALAQNENKAAVIELNCETDFVSRNDVFQYLASALAKKALLVESYSQLVSGVFKFSSEDLEDLKLDLGHPKVSGETTVKLRKGIVMPTSSHGVVSTYLHTSPQPGLGGIAGILSLAVEDKITQLDAIQRIGSQLAMHVVAAKPLFLTKELVSSEALESEREILKSQAESTGKSQMAIEKMVEGRLRKYYEEVVLVEQKFIMDDTITVKMKGFFSEDKILSRKPPYYKTSEMPDMWFSPALVWEIRGADFTVSPVHQAAVGLVHPSRGISIRFPRYIRTVADRKPDECSTAEDIAAMFHSQTRKMDVTTED